jgi:hypothetical protein
LLNATFRTNRIDKLLSFYDIVVQQNEHISQLVPVIYTVVFVDRSRSPPICITLCSNISPLLATLVGVDERLDMGKGKVKG